MMFKTRFMLSLDFSILTVFVDGDDAIRGSVGVYRYDFLCF